MDTLTNALRHAQHKKQLPAPATRRFLREKSGITQLSVARALGVTQTTISRYETGSRQPRGEALERYLSVLDRLAREGLSG